jgi:hypothetical protein
MLHCGRLFNIDSNYHRQTRGLIDRGSRRVFNSIMLAGSSWKHYERVWLSGLDLGITMLGEGCAYALQTGHEPKLACRLVAREDSFWPRGDLVFG